MSSELGEKSANERQGPDVGIVLTPNLNGVQTKTRGVPSDTESSSVADQEATTSGAKQWRVKLDAKSRRDLGTRSPYWLYGSSEDVPGLEGYW